MSRLRLFLAAVLLAPFIGTAQTNIPLVNPTFDFTTEPSGSTTTTGWTTVGGNGVPFTASPSGSTSDRTANAPGWSSIGSGSAGFQRLNGVWDGTPPSGGVGYANNGGVLTQTVTNVLAPSLNYTLTGQFYPRSTDPFPSPENIAVGLNDQSGNPLNSQFTLYPETNGIIAFMLSATSGATVAGSNLTVVFANSSAAYAQMDFDNLQLTAQPAMPSTNPPPGAVPPAAMAPSVYGSHPGTPFLLYLAAAGVGTNRTWTASDVPAGLTLNATNGVLSGTTPAAGEYDIPWSATGSLASVHGCLHLMSGTRLALTPPIGWNSWNVFEGTVNETNIEQIADAIVNSGLNDYGFAYVNLDDEWAESSRVPAGQQMCLIGDTNRFSSGLAALGDYLHQRGLKFGIYSDAASSTCSGDQPGSYGYESVDAGTFASWGVDYLKYDYCNAPTDETNAILRYTAMGGALTNCGRSVVFSVCEWGQREPWQWAAQAGGSLWRTTLDMRDEWEFVTNDLRSQDAIGVLDGLDLAEALPGYQSPGAWNDPDMLMLGVPLAGSVAAFGASGLNLTQQQAMFSIWALLSAPMIFNADLRQLDPKSPLYNASWAANIMGVLTNTEVWALDQDRLGSQASRERVDGTVDIWRKDLWDGSVAIGLINRGAAAAQTSISPSDVLVNGPLLTARDLWQHRDLGVLTNNSPYSLGAYQTTLLRFRPARIEARSNSPNTVQLSFDAGAVLESSTNLLQWQIVPSTGTSLDVSVTDACRYWRLKMP